MTKTLTKRCERCEKLFTLPNLKESRARELLIVYHPCTHCGYSRDFPGDSQGRCTDCLLPFAVFPNHARGKCKRCHMAWLRSQPPQR